MQRLHQLASQCLVSSPSAVPQKHQDLVLVERLSDIKILHMNSPHNRNTLTLQMMSQLNAALRRADQDDSVKGVVIMGGGSCFSQGGDLFYFKDMNVAKMLYKKAYSQIYDVLPKMKKPVVAAVHGLAHGAAFDLALLCDLIVAEANSQFAVSNIKAGFLPGPASSKILPRLIGKARTMQLVLTGDSVAASKLYKWGAVNTLVNCERGHAGQRVKEQAVAIMRSISKYSRIVTLQAKSAIQNAYDSNLKTGIETERKMFYSLWGLKDTHEGMKAFLSKRKPQWTHS